jgi:hypothetical protein
MRHNAHHQYVTGWQRTAEPGETMDHIGAEMMASLPLDLGSIGRSFMATDEIPLADIDVRFTVSAIRVIERCQKTLESSPDCLPDLTEHLTRAFWDTPECSVAKLMVEDGILSDEFINCLEVLLGGSYGMSPVIGTPSSNLRLERVIIRAKREAYRRRHPEASTMHLLWGLLRERSGPSIYEWEQAATGMNSD